MDTFVSAAKRAYLNSVEQERLQREKQETDASAYVARASERVIDLAIGAGFIPEYIRPYAIVQDPVTGFTRLNLLYKTEFLIFIRYDSFPLLRVSLKVGLDEISTLAESAEYTVFESDNPRSGRKVFDSFDVAFGYAAVLDEYRNPK